MSAVEDLRAFATRIAACLTPEDLFGSTVSAREVKSAYKRYALLTHEDRYAHETRAVRQLANKAFSRLTELYGQATRKFEKGTYGKTVVVATVRTKRHTYTVSNALAAGDLANLYVGADETDADVILKVARAEGDNDLLDTEADLLKRLTTTAAKTKAFGRYLPDFVESSRLDGRAMNVFRLQPGYVPLTVVKERYPTGVDPRHFVWMWRRLLSVLGFAHSVAVVHGAVLPPHILINPTNHGLMLIDWAYGRRDQSAIKAITVPYTAWYPPEVLAKQPAGPGTDLYMSAECMSWVLGGFPERRLPTTVPLRFQQFLSSCLLKNLARRPTDAFEVHDGFSELSKAIYGPRKFVALAM